MLVSEVSHGATGKLAEFIILSDGMTASDVVVYRSLKRAATLAWQVSFNGRTSACQAEITFSAVRQHRHDDITGAHLLGNLGGGEDIRSGRYADQQPFLTA